MTSITGPILIKSMSLLSGRMASASQEVGVDEFQLIQRYIKPIQSSPVVLGRGDDCSVVQLTPETYLIETTDCLVEDVHFRRHHFSFAELAFKSLAVNISDIAAMGGTPLRAHLSLALPKGILESEIKVFFETFYELAEQCGIALIGGDISGSPSPIFVNVHLSGVVDVAHIKWRAGLGRPGVLAVTGTLGDSAAGFYCLEKSLFESEDLINNHKRPPVLLKESQWLSKRPEVQGVMDLSDGLMSDLHRVEKGRAEIAIDQLPISSNLRALSEKENISHLQWVLGGGEDYHLLINCQEQAWDQLQADFEKELGQKLFQIGINLESDRREVVFMENDKPLALDIKSFKHF